MFRYVILGSAVVAALGVTGIARADLTWHPPGAAPYLSAADSPFITDTWSYTHLEDLEDAMVNTPGLTVSGADVRGPGNFTDSVDSDDGVIDGLGIAGHSLWGSSTSGAQVVLHFDGNALEGLPTHAGFAWTDGSASAIVTIEVYGPGPASVPSGSMTAMLGDTMNRGTTAEDRFIGVELDGGISQIRITTDLGGVELDHIQYGLVPAPGGLALIAIGLIGRGRRRRSSGRRD